MKMCAFHKLICQTKEADLHGVHYVHQQAKCLKLFKLSLAAIRSLCHSNCWPISIPIIEFLCAISQVITRFY